MTEGARRQCRLALTRKNTETHEALSPALFSSNHGSEESRHVTACRPGVEVRLQSGTYFNWKVKQAGAKVVDLKTLLSL